MSVKVVSTIARRGRRGSRSHLNRGGHERFAGVGHDRGTCVAFRLALDHPDRVIDLVVLD